MPLMTPFQGCFNLPLTTLLEQNPNFGVKFDNMNRMRKTVIFLVSLYFTISLSGQAPVKWYTVEEAFILTKKEPKKRLRIPTDKPLHCRNPKGWLRRSLCNLF